MKRLIYQVYVGKRAKLYDFCTESVAEYCKKYGIDHHIQRTPILMIKPDVFMTNRSKESYEKYGGYLPIYEKENAFTYFNSYDQVLILDADIYIKSDAPNIFDELDETTDFAGVVEREMPLNRQYQNKIVGYSKMQYGNIKNVDWKWNQLGGEFFNMGMMLMNNRIKKYLNNETPRQFLARPRFKPFIDGVGPWKWSTDQTLLNVWLKEEQMNVKHLNWKWNALYTAIPNEKIRDAHFIHFFLRDKLPARGENINQLRAICGI